MAMLRATTAITLLLSTASADSDGAKETAVPTDSSSVPQAAESVCDGEWRDVEPGLRRRSLCTDGEATLHLGEIDPARWTLDAVRVAPTTAAEVARDGGATFAINANFFDPD